MLTEEPKNKAQRRGEKQGKKQGKSKKRGEPREEAREVVAVFPLRHQSGLETNLDVAQSRWDKDC